jgi:hypothetical protein
MNVVEEQRSPATVGTKLTVSFKQPKGNGVERARAQI